MLFQFDNGPSTRMESKIMFDDFKCNGEEYGLIFRYYSGDADPSVFEIITEGCKYGELVRKLSAKNFK